MTRSRANRISRTAIRLAALLAIIVSGTSGVARSAPALFFSDITSGPKTGGQDNLGAFVTLYGEGFGASQGSSTVTIGGQPVARTLIWGANNALARGLDLIVVQPGPDAATGNIVVTVAGQGSNPLPFTVRSGNIYFVTQATGSDGNPGTFAQPWKTLWRPRGTVQSGDIVYVKGGTFTQMDPDYPGWDTLLMLDASSSASGTASRPVAYIGYPGDPPTLANGSARRGIMIRQDNGPLSYYVIAGMKLTLSGSPIPVTGVGHRVVGSHIYSAGPDYDAIGILGDTSAIRLFGNLLDHNGAAGNKLAHALYIEGFGTNRDIEFGYNEVRNQQGGRAIQIYGHESGDLVDDVRIHDNLISGSELNNLVLGGSDGATEVLGTIHVYNNIVVGAGAEGLRVNDPQGTVIIQNNTFYGNGTAQVYLEEAGTGRVLLRDNIIYAGAGQAYYELESGQSDSTSFAASGNLVYNAGPCPPWDGGCVNADPLFVNLPGGDYHLQTSSPAKEAGVSTGITSDFEGNARPQGAAIDIGAYEYATQVPVCRVSCSVTVPAAAAPGDDVAFQASTTLVDCAGGSVSHSWDFGDGSTSTEQNPLHAYAAAGVYSWSFTATASGAQPCDRSGSISIGSNPGGTDLTGTWTKVSTRRSRLNATFSCQNIGTEDVGGFVVSVYLSRKAAVNSKSTLVKSQAIASLPAGASADIKLSAKMSSKHKYVIAIVDSLRGVPETDENNNTVSRRLVVVLASQTDAEAPFPDANPQL